MEKNHHNVVAAVITHAGEVLCMQRGQTKFEYTSYKWEFPGGKIEPGETPEEALHREIFEEMEMDVQVGRHLATVDYEYPDFRITMAAYLCTPVGGRAFVMNEHHSYRWLVPSQLSTLDWAAADIGIMEMILGGANEILRLP